LVIGDWLLSDYWCLRFGNPYLPQVEQVVAEQPLQEELAVLLNFPLLENAKADIIRTTFLLLHWGQTIFSEERKTNFSNS